MAVWQQVRMQGNIWVVQLAADLEETQQHQNEYQEAYQTAQTELQELQTQLDTINEDHQATLHQIQDRDTYIQRHTSSHTPKPPCFIPKDTWPGKVWWQVIISQLENWDDQQDSAELQLKERVWRNQKVHFQSHY